VDTVAGGVPVVMEVDARAEGAGKVGKTQVGMWVPKKAVSYEYDLDGNLTADGQWQYTWDAENRLVACETRVGILPPVGRFPLSQRRKLEFGYDYMGRRVSKKVSNWDGAGWQLLSHRVFVYDGWNLIAECDALRALAVVRSYAWGQDLSASMQGAGGVGGLLFVREHNRAGAAASTGATCMDGNGNVLGLFDMGSAQLLASYEYGAFGEPLKAVGPSALSNPFRFSTKYTDDETGLVYYGYRYYSPSAGRWLSRDPLDEPGHEAVRAVSSYEEGAPWQNDFAPALLAPEVLVDDVEPFAVGNAYLGMQNNPLSYVDPDGRNPLLIARALLLKLLKDRVKKIAECEAIYYAYKASDKNAAGCKPCLTRPEYVTLLTARGLEVGGRALYLKKRCDYILPGSIGAGSKSKEASHRQELTNKIGAFGNCAANAVKAGFTDLPQLPALP